MVHSHQMNQRDNAACLESLQLFVDQALMPLALEGFQSMYKQGEEIRLAQTAENLTNLDVMRQLLEEVRTWTQVLLEEEVRRIEARIPYLQKLLTALFVMKVKVLSCINMRKVAAEFPLTIPSNHTFVHNFYIHAARSLADNLPLVENMKMSNMRELLSDALRRAEFDCLRWDELLSHYMDGVEPSEALRDMMAARTDQVDDESARDAHDVEKMDDNEFDSMANEEKSIAHGSGGDAEEAAVPAGVDHDAFADERHVSDDHDSQSNAVLNAEEVPRDTAPRDGAVDDAHTDRVQDQAGLGFSNDQSGSDSDEDVGREGRKGFWG